jgi:hypothetical protein
MNYWDLAKLFTRWFRKRRLNEFTTLFPPARYHRVLDIGGTSTIWEMLDYPADITLVNIDPAVLKYESSNPLRSYTTVVGDGRKLAIPDKSFDLAFANSVIEHVGDEEDASALASEMSRIAKAFYCQTPNKWFPVEPHLGTLFLHWIPGLLDQYFVVRYCTLWGLMNKPNREQARAALKQTRLLTKSEMKKLFPTAELRVERFLFVLPKSFIAIGKAS